MRKCFLLKLSLRILDQLNVLIFVLPCKDRYSSQSRTCPKSELQKHDGPNPEPAGHYRGPPAQLSLLLGSEEGLGFGG